MKADESGIDWRMETIDFSRVYHSDCFLQKKKSGAQCRMSWRALGVASVLTDGVSSQTSRNARLLGFIVRLYPFSHDMEHQAEGSQESSLSSIEILTMYVMLLLPARPEPETLDETTESLLTLFTPVIPGKRCYLAEAARL